MYNKIESPPVKDTQKFKIKGRKVKNPNIKRLGSKSAYGTPDFPHIFCDSSTGKPTKSIKNWGIW